MIINRYNYRTWLDKYYDFFERHKIHYSYCAIITATLIFFLGLSCSIIGDFVKLYLTSIHIYLALAGIIWVMTWYRWGYLKLFRITKDLLFFSNISDRKNILRKLHKKMKLATKSKYVVISSSFLTILFNLSIYIWYSKYINLYSITFMKPFLADAWFSGPFVSVMFKALSLFIYASFIAFLVGTIGYEIVIFDVCILKILSKNIDKKKYLSIRYKLNQITNFNIKVTFSWSVGVGICILAVIDKNSPIIWSYIGIFTLISLLTFILPQYILHRSLKKIKNNLLFDLSRIINNLIFCNIPLNKINSDRFSNITQYYALIKNSSTYMANISIVPKLLFTTIFPQLLSLYIKNKFNI